jgi:hypothetical protein
MDKNINNKISVSTNIIIFYGRRWVVAHGITDFAVTTSWCYRFMKRHGLSKHTRTRTAQKMPAEYEMKILQFQKFVIAARKKSCFELGQTGHMDDVPLTFNVP